MNKKYIFLLMLFLVLPRVIFAKTYTPDEMAARQKAYDSETGLTYVTENQPILTDPQSNTSLEAFEYKGQIYPEGTSMLTIDEKGNTGNVTEGQYITHDNNNVNGSEDNTLRFEGKGEMVYFSIEPDGSFAYKTPTIKVKIYTDKIYTRQDTIDRLNNNETILKQVKMITGDDKLTLDNYDKVAKFIDIGELGDHMVFSGFERADSVQYLEIMWDGEYYNANGVIKNGIVVVEGFGTGGEHMYDYYLTNKLYSIFGDGVIDLDEWTPDEPDSDDPNPDDSDPGGGGGGGATWTSYGAVSMSANVSSDIYNVSEAIPTSENITGTVSAKDIGWNYGINKVYKSTPYYFFEGYLCWDYGLISDDYYDASGEYHPEVWGCRQSTTATVPANYTTHYFDVAYAEMSRLSGASVSNETTGVLASVGPASTEGFLNRIGDVITDDSDMPKTISGCGGTGDYNAAFAAAKSNAEYEIKKRTYAQNDYMVIGSGVLSGITPKGEEFGNAPNVGPYSTWTKPTSTDLSSSDTKMIPEYKTNGWYYSSASASYSAVPSFDGKSDSAGASPSNVFVHTPVVNKTQIVADNFINQKVVQESGLTYLQLDKGFTITIPDDGTHIGAQGYGTRTYNSGQAVPKKITNWGKKKDVKVPFDAYLEQGGKMTLIKADTWLSDYSGIDTTSNSFTFLIPVWSEEAKGTIETRVVAENIPIYNNGSTVNTVYIQDYGNANTDSSKYIAQDKVEVEVIGKIYDLRIQGTNDPGWPGVKGENGAYITSAEFPFGQLNQNTMSVYKFAPKLGYTVEFDFKTKGVKTDNVDVSIQPEGFYFISKDGGNAEKVDLYFKTVTNQYVKIDPSANTSDIIVNLSNPFMKVAKSELIDSTRIMKQQVKVLYTYTQDVLIGKLPSLNIPEKLRLCYNNFAEYIGTSGLYKKSQAEIANDANGGLSYSTGKYDQVNNGNDTVIASVGHWYAAYRLPSSTVAVKPGTPAKQIMTNPNVIKKNGYILVKFDIVGKNGDEDYLRYTGPESIMEPGTYEDDKKWQDPDGDPNPSDQPVTLPNGKPEDIPDGTVILFETDWRANNDSEVIGTH